MIPRAALCVASLLLAAASPERAPTRFTTHNYQLNVRIPPGLFHCRYPAAWVGSDHGISLYLEQPQGCDPGSPAASDEEARHLPQIRFFYSYNVADMEPYGRPPRTNTELHQQACKESFSGWPAPMAMLGVAATTCFEHRGDTISLAAGTLYRQSTVAAAPPDSQAWLILQTTARRYPYDFKLFQTILKTIAVCRAKDRPPQPPRPACPPFIQW